ncbi:hypothetical protein ACJIZ3_003960 [Penstemon smallii]|uniref:Uncharacterized protein n=1 Tax=Penstemon smallii TaxID=265156 RepID=A0ABD3S0P6_9LAMI
MELDFDKYCVVDGSPTTVLPSPRLHSKVANRKSNRTSNCGNEIPNLRKNFTEISFNRYRSASCRDVQSTRASQEGNEMLKRASVYQSSKETRLLKKTDKVSGRKKIVLSREGTSKSSFGIIDSLCSSDEDSSLTELRSRDSKNCSFHPIPSKNQSTYNQPIQDPMIINDGYLQKSLSAKLSLPHSPSKSESDGSRAASPKARFRPVRKIFDPFVKSKSQKSPLSCSNETSNETIHLNDLSDKIHNSVSQCSPAHLHAVLKMENKNGMPFFEFYVKSPEDFYVAKKWKVEKALNWVYTFQSLHHKRKSNASGWGSKESHKESTILGQMHVSFYPCTESKGDGSFNDSMVTEFVLYDIFHSRKSTSSQDNSKTPLVYDERLSCHQPMAAAELHAELENAAVIMKVPFEKRESLKLKSGDNKKTDKPLSNLLDLCHHERTEEESISEISNPGKMHVVIPAGTHSLPSNDERSGPTSLLDRWRLGGGCDCGGWDMACPLNVLGNPNIQISEGQPMMDNQHPAQLFVQGRKDNFPAFTMRLMEEGKYSVDFHAQLSSLQAFSISIAILHAAEASTAERSEHMLRSDAKKVFSEEEIEILIDSIEKEDAHRVNNKKVEEALPSFVLNPPFSPIARV